MDLTPPAIDNSSSNFRLVPAQPKMLSWSQLETFLSATRKWLPGPIIFIVLVVILFALRHLLLRWIARASNDRGQWIDALLRALSPSLGVAILVAALAVAMGFEPIPVNWRLIANAILTGGIILALIVLVDGLLMFWMRRAGRRPSRCWVRATESSSAS